VAGRPSRKLAVILHADVVGSTALVQRDEALAHERIRDAFQRLSGTIESYNGHPLELRGDALLAEFNRASDAVEASLAFQAENTRFNSTLEDDIQPTLRIGISLGEVVVADNTVTGEGIVLAQRLEQLASAGGVCIQGAVQEAVPGRLPFEYESLGEQELKGFSEPVRAYAVSLTSGEAIPPPELRERPRRQWIVGGAVALIVIVAGGLTWWQPWKPEFEPASVERMKFELPDKSSIAVLPFENLSGDPKQEYLSDGISENIITELSRFRELFVIARQSSFSYKGKPVKVHQVSEELGVQYVLEGSLQRAGDKVRVTAQLIDATTGRHLWAERYDREIEDFFAVQDEITRTIVATLEETIDLAEQERAKSKAPQNLKAYEHVKLGITHWLKFTKEGNERARQLHEKARELDPSYAEPYVGLTWVNINDYRYGWSDTHSREESLRLALETAKQAVELDAFSHRTHWVLAHALMQSGKLEQAFAEYDRSLELNPNSARVLADMPEPLVRSGRAEEAVSRVKSAIRLNPHHPEWYLWNLGWAQYFAEQYEEALASLRRMVNPPNGVRRTLAPVLVRLGRLDEARAVVQEFLRHEPSFNLEETKTFAGFQHQAYRDRWVDDLRKAGIPEKPPLSLPDKPSIAVLPFTNMSGDPEQEYFVDGITEDLITDLSKVSGLRVVARTSAFTYKGQSPDLREVGRDLNVRYVLEGSVRKASGKLRITAQLVDASNGYHLWAERYDRNLEDIFALQDEVTQKIVTALSVTLTGQEKEQLARAAANNFEAYDLFLRGQRYFKGLTKDDNASAQEMYKRAIGLDPTFARAYGALAVSYGIDFRRGWSTHPAETLDRALELAQKAVALDGSLPQVQWALGYVYVFKKQYQQATDALEHAVRIAPNYADGYALLALINNVLGRPEEAVRLIRKAMTLNPYYGFDYPYNLGRAYYMMGRYAEAVDALQEANERNGAGLLPRLFLAASYIRLGQQDDAEWEIDEIEALDPEYTISTYANMSRISNKDQLNSLLDDLRKAGLPE
jgi:TolB-like protein/class 3 adenylate cyclase/Flp pilus assembly protein TadD